MNTEEQDGDRNRFVLAEDSHKLSCPSSSAGVPLPGLPPVKVGEDLHLSRVSSPLQPEETSEHLLKP